MKTGVLGTGCPRYQNTEHNVGKAQAEIQVEAEGKIPPVDQIKLLVTGAVPWGLQPPWAYVGRGG